jgi:hypothetical protein
MNEKPKQATIQKEIEREDDKFLKGGIIAVVVIGLLLLFGAYVLIRHILLPTMGRLFGTINKPTASPTTTADSQGAPILKTIDDVPLEWATKEAPELGITINYPENATVEENGATLTIDMPEAIISLTKRNKEVEELEDQATRRKNNIDQETSDDLSQLSEAEVAAIAGYSFTIDSNPTKQYIFIDGPDKNSYIEIAIARKTDKEEDRQVIEDVLKSIEFAGDEPMRQPMVVE